MTTRQVQAHLRQLGWPIRVDGRFGPQTFAAVRDFQRGFAFGRPLRVDGHAGPVVWRALDLALERGGRTSPHFRFREFKSRGNGWIKVARSLVLGLEAYRELVGGPFPFAAYRDPLHNAKVGGVPDSQHLFGNAADLMRTVATLDQVKKLRRFSGIGVQRATGKVRHVDVRHVGPNTTRGTTTNPTIWFYG